MMETLKRHAFILGLVAGVVVISLAVGLITYFLYVGPNSDMRNTLRSTKTRGSGLLNSPLFTEEHVTKMGEQVGRRQAQYDELLGFVRDLGKQRKPLVDGLFPQTTRTELRHAFKAEYKLALERFVTRLGAKLPRLPADKDGKISQAAQAIALEENRKATMFTDPAQTFHVPEWVDRQEAPNTDQCRYGQENIWLMEDLVEIIASLNDEVLKDANPKTIVNAPVKELISIRIGGEFAVLEGAQMGTTGGRYRPGPSARGGRDKAAVAGRAPTVSGRYSKADFYLVLPWRLVVVTEARYMGELVRRLKGRETFLSVEAWRSEPIAEATFGIRSGRVFALTREDYGRQGAMRLEVVGESLVFQLQGGRVTTLVKAEPPKKKEDSATN